ncbi:hypothetical protein [Streptomyces sp. NBC_01006]|uniref:hypothetical protein n=1 Tax=Streptomyces sp. NBC_01006 TaxID=2903716 RepID=UPI00386BB8E8|nr:hypothetical protein OG509_01455 [Streptomyces sp. NBC_01006]
MADELGGRAGAPGVVFLQAGQVRADGCRPAVALTDLLQASGRQRHGAGTHEQARVPLAQDIRNRGDNPGADGGADTERVQWPAPV